MSDPDIPLSTAEIMGKGTGNDRIAGLTRQEVNSLREQYGFNDIPQDKKHPLLKFLGYFWERAFPSLALFGTAEITQIVATLIAIYGIFMTPPSAGPLRSWSGGMPLWRF